MMLALSQEFSACEEASIYVRKVESSIGYREAFEVVLDHAPLDDRARLVEELIGRFHFAIRTARAHVKTGDGRASARADGRASGYASVLGLLGYGREVLGDVPDVPEVASSPFRDRAP